MILILISRCEKAKYLIRIEHDWQNAKYTIVYTLFYFQIETFNSYLHNIWSYAKPSYNNLPCHQKPCADIIIASEPSHLTIFFIASNTTILQVRHLKIAKL